MNFNETEYICRECSGRKIIHAPSIIQIICPSCNGRGRKDWVTYAMGGNNPYKPPEHQLLYNITQRNIQALVQEIKMQAAQIDQYINVSLKFENERDFSQMCMSEIYPPIKFPKIKDL